MNAIEAYNASSTCVCGGIPQLMERGRKFQIECGACGSCGPICETPEQAVATWNLHVEALGGQLSVTDILCRENPRMAKLLGQRPIGDPAPVIAAARACANGLEGAWGQLMQAIAAYDGRRVELE